VCDYEDGGTVAMMRRCLRRCAANAVSSQTKGRSLTHACGDYTPLSSRRDHVARLYNGQSFELPVK